MIKIKDGEARPGGDVCANHVLIYCQIGMIYELSSDILC